METYVISAWETQPTYTMFSSVLAYSKPRTEECVLGIRDAIYRCFTKLVLLEAVGRFDLLLQAAGEYASQLTRLKLSPQAGLFS